MFFFFKQKTAYEMRISDWSSHVCSSDLFPGTITALFAGAEQGTAECGGIGEQAADDAAQRDHAGAGQRRHVDAESRIVGLFNVGQRIAEDQATFGVGVQHFNRDARHRSEEHTSELQSLMRISYAVICLKKKKRN